MLLIAGGQADPNLQALADAAARQGRPWIDLRLPVDSSPPFHWELEAGREAPLPWGDGAVPRGGFIRQDVFASLADPRPEVGRRAQGWFNAVQGWLLAHPSVRLFNRHIRPTAFNKPAALMRARAHGLRVPDTWLSNDAERLRERAGTGAGKSLGHIAKPVAGGGLCQTLAAALHQASGPFTAMPALVQPRLVAPELRVFVIGGRRFAFEVRSPSLDYRALQDAELHAVPVPEEAEALVRLMVEFGMDFGAADFKTDPTSRQLVFLELNTSPMFARFDACSGGALCRAMVDELHEDPAITG